MKSIVIVDDEMLTVQGLLTTIDWKTLEIGPVYTAYSMQQAIEVFGRHSIDIMLCDVEMPQGSGLDLLSWVYENSPDTVSIFLTCHNEFEFVHKALKLGCMDYVLKPILKEPLEKVLEAAVKRVSVVQELKKIQEFGNRWKKERPVVEEKFWQDLLTHKMSTERGALRNTVVNGHFNIDLNADFIMLVVGLERMNPEMLDWGASFYMYAIQNVIREIILKNNDEMPIFSMGPKVIVTVIRMRPEDNTQEETEKIVCSCEDFIKKSQVFLSSDFSCYIGDVCKVEELPEMYDKLLDLRSQNVAYFSSVIKRSEGYWDTSSVEPAPLTLWTDMLLSGQSQQVYNAITDYLEKLVHNRQINHTVLYLFLQDVLQMIYKALTERNILAHQLLADILVEDSDQEMYASVSGAEKILKELLHVVAQYIDINRKSDSVVHRVKEYVQKNLELDLSCEKIAAAFYLNADYLTRLMKKETGMSLSDIITTERINAAKNLLANTNMQVTMIAIQTGYNNVSYFSSVFRRLTGKTPVEYRQLICSNTDKNPSARTSDM